MIKSDAMYAARMMMSPGTMPMSRSMAKWREKSSSLVTTIVYLNRQNKGTNFTNGNILPNVTCLLQYLIDPTAPLTLR